MAGVVERCYEGGGGGDQEQALLRRACVFRQPAATKTGIALRRERRVRAAANHARSNISYHSTYERAATAHYTTFDFILVAS